MTVSISAAIVLRMNTIRKFRESKKLSQADFAKVISKYGLPASQGLISQWENGLVRITCDRAIQIEKASQGEINRMELIFGPPPPNKEEAA